jgi:hypothetical protein
MSKDRQAFCHFHYPGPEAWKAQFLRRLFPGAILRRGETWALIEETADTDRLLLTVPAAAKAEILRDFVRLPTGHLSAGDGI